MRAYTAQVNNVINTRTVNGTLRHRTADSDGIKNVKCTIDRREKIKLLFK